MNKKMILIKERKMFEKYCMLLVIDAITQINYDA